MKKTSIAALLISAVVAVPAFASGVGPAPFYRPQVETTAQASTVTRAEVRADVAQARAAGELNANANAPAWPVRMAAVSTNATNAPKTRSEVKAELAQARANGELSLNPSAPAYPRQFATGGYTVPRAQIHTQLSQGSVNGASVED